MSVESDGACSRRSIVESHIFWFVAALSCALAVGFSLKGRQKDKDGAKGVNPRLVKGQEKDNWLTCAVVWIVIFGAHTKLAGVLELLGAVVLTWVGWRTLGRAHTLER